MIKLYHFIFQCFCSMVVWNPDQGKIKRAVYGMTFLAFNLLFTLLFVVGAKFGWKFNGYLVGVLGLLFMLFFYRSNVIYFSSHEKRFPITVKKKWLILIGCILLYGSFFSMGFSGKNFSKKSKLRKLKTELRSN